MITKYNEICIICDKPKDDFHHCLKGYKQRHLADADGLIIPVCRQCHEAIHKHKELNVLVEIIGQLAFEREYLIEKQLLPFDDSHDEISDEAREAFRRRYGCSYI